jgi:hypothetical protein
MARVASGPIVILYRMKDVDLAAIVLADPGRRRSLAPESTPLDTDVRGFDARSVLVLALVVAVMAGVIGWATMRGPAAPPATKASATPTPTPEAQERPASETKVEQPAAPIAPRGVDLAPARIVTTSSGGSGIVRVDIANQGRTALGASGVAVLVLLDGQSIGEDTVGAIDATGSTTTEFNLGYCPSGSHAVAVVIDPRGQVREADERDNARTQTVAFRC